MESELLGNVKLREGHAGQGLASGPDGYYASTVSTLYRFNHDWQLVAYFEIRVEGVNHMGAIEFHDGFVWAGFLNHGKTDGKYDPKKNHSIIAKIDRETLKVVAMWDITADCTWIDLVCFDGTRLWVGEMHNLGIHCYRLVNDEVVRDVCCGIPEK